MDYKELIHRLVNELSFRVGIPDLESKEQQTIISEILSEWGNLDEKKIIMEFLTEAEPEKSAEDEKYKNTGGSGYVKASEYDKWKSNPKGDFEKFTKGPSGKYVPQVDTEQEGEKEEKEQGTALNDKSYKKIVSKEKETQKKIDDENNDVSSNSDNTVETNTKRRIASVEKSIKISEELKENLDFIIKNKDTTRLKSGGGSNSPTLKEVEDLKEFTERRMEQDRRRLSAEKEGIEFKEEPYVHPSINQKVIDDESLDASLKYMEDNLEQKEYEKLIKKFAMGGAVPTHLTRLIKLKKKEEGYPGFDKKSTGYIRAREIIRLYLKNDGKSPVTGEPLPLSHMEPDHRVPFTTSDEDLVESNQFPGLSLKTKKPADGNSIQEIMKMKSTKYGDYEKKVVAALEPLQAKYDNPIENMDLLSGPVNQFKGSLIDDKLLNSIAKKLTENPGEKKLKDEYTTERKRLLNVYHKGAIDRGENPPYDEKQVRDADIVETNEMMKVHNYYHPDAKTVTEHTGGNSSKAIPANPNYYDEVKEYWKNKGEILPENIDDVDFNAYPFNQTMTVYVSAGRSRGGAKRRSLKDDHEYMLSEFEKFKYTGNSISADDTQDGVVNEARFEINRKIDEKLINYLKIQLDNPELTDRKRKNLQDKLDGVVAQYQE